MFKCKNRRALNQQNELYKFKMQMLKHKIEKMKSRECEYYAIVLTFNFEIL